MKTAITYFLTFIILTPAVTAGASITASLIEGQTPSEAIETLAISVTDLFARVDTLEVKQQQNASTTIDLEARLQTQIDQNVQGNIELDKKNKELSNKLIEVSNRPPQIIETVKETVVQIPTPPTIAPEPETIPDTTAPKVNLAPWGKRWANDPYFSNGLYGKAGISEWELIRDNESGVATVQYFIDDISIDGPRAMSTGNFGVMIDTTLQTNGQHILRLEVTDKAGNKASSSLQITINN
ncbi:hypothetical protein A2704_01400 [Candidatus Kaiserbacteria bacterium RIFCSPHIGHO2_01_FULL_54_36b]|uniref:Uncharacterized protein n=1 Tax=Candidatus Kaiserbacteria bacterium RIFCSPHIGHO2_01_FULL_54_36b TaxID=1798483 RepID=A0A1F6CIT9_9BACT|nr:MAG: hypothetical protein A2704_01400 [Candidatus Kaiserbacteria bacterium RIFCSPHIGHO2_01_FULL_54_36b]